MLTHHYTWFNKELKNFQPLLRHVRYHIVRVSSFGILTSGARILTRTDYIAYMSYHPPF